MADTYKVYRSFSAAVSDFVERLLEWVMLWPLLTYAFILHTEPTLFERGVFYTYMESWAPQRMWELAFLLAATVRCASLVLKMFWAWPFYSPLALFASVCAGTLFAQMSMSFLNVWMEQGIIFSSFGAVSTLVFIELVNIRHSAKGVGLLLRRR